MEAENENAAGGDDGNPPEPRSSLAPARWKDPQETFGEKLGKIFAITIIIGAISIAAFGWPVGRAERRKRECQRNLTLIDGAKEQYALENNKRAGDSVEWKNIINEPGATGYLNGPIPRCPSGHDYVINPLGSNPVCTSELPGHSLSEVGTPHKGGCS